MGLVLTSLLTLGITVGLALLEKFTSFKDMGYRKKQILIGILFGISACLASDYGLKVDGAIVNVRDAAPLSAGMLFGAPAGIIAGFIGGIYRMLWGSGSPANLTLEWFSTMWQPNVTGGFTRAACTLGTIVAGLAGAVVRKRLFNDKKPTWAYGLGIGLTVEVTHLFMVFVFRLDDLSKVYSVIKACSVKMVVANALTVMVGTMIVQLLAHDKRNKTEKENDLAGAFQKRLLVCVVFAFLITVFAMALIQYRLGIQRAVSTLEQSLTDVENNIEAEGGVDQFLRKTKYTWHIGDEGGIIIGKFKSGVREDVSSVDIVMNTTGIQAGGILNISEIIQGHMHMRGVPSNFFDSDILVNGESKLVFGMYQIKDEYVVMVYMPKTEALIFSGVTTALIIFFEILVFATVFLLIYLLIKRLVVDNLHKINRTLAEITGGNLDAQVDVRSHSEFAYLSDDINQTVLTLKHYIEDAAARIDQELEYAKNIQMSTLPSVFPPYPNRFEFDIFACMETAKEVGGDFYDFYFVGDDKLAFLIADVSGKGIPAAMFMMEAKSMIKSYAETGLPVDEVFNTVNDNLCADNDAGMFVTAFLCVLDLKTGLLRYANAGHNPPLIRIPDVGFEYTKVRRGFVLAGMEGMMYREGEIQLNPGDAIFLYTDGITEATNAENQLYGEDRLKAVLNKDTNINMRLLCGKVKEDVDAFVGEAPQFDDMTMVALRYWGDSKVKSIVVDATIENLDTVTDFVNEVLESFDCPMKIQMQISVAIDEIFGNIVHYAYEGQETGKVNIIVRSLNGPDTIWVTFEDYGVPYNPLVKEDPDVTLSADERQIGGLGIFIVKKTMDDMRYEYADGKNILTIRKNIRL